MSHRLCHITIFDEGVPRHKPRVLPTYIPYTIQSNESFSIRIEHLHFWCSLPLLCCSRSPDDTQCSRNQYDEIEAYFIWINLGTGKLENFRWNYYRMRNKCVFATCHAMRHEKKAEWFSLKIKQDYSLSTTTTDEKLTFTEITSNCQNVCSLKAKTQSFPFAWLPNAPLYFSV